MCGYITRFCIRSTIIYHLYEILPPSKDSGVILCADDTILYYYWDEEMLQFLCLPIDDKLTWLEHIAYTHSKLSRSLCCEPYQILDSTTVFENTDRNLHSHISYGITLWGGICKVSEQNMHKLEKGCMIYAQKQLLCLHYTIVTKEQGIKIWWPLSTSSWQICVWCSTRYFAKAIFYKPNSV